jgi:predicted nucleic acid-binding Zn ribbon protein
MTISLSTSSVKQTASIVVSGSMSPAVAGALVTLSYTKPDGSTTDRQVQTGQDGTFSDTLAGSDTTPLDVGTWEVYASWEGDQAHTGAKTQTVSFQVTETPFIERYATVLGAVAVVVIVALAGGVFYFRSKKGAPPVEKKPPTREAVISGRPAPILVEVPRPTPVIVEVPTPTPVVVETRPAKPAPPLILPRKRCFNCGEVISAQAKFCDKCRAPQPEKIEKKYEAPSLIIPRKYCVNCGEVISAQATFCDKCRAPQPG